MTAPQRSSPPDAPTAGCFHYVDWVYTRATPIHGDAGKNIAIGGNSRGRDLVRVPAGQTSVPSSTSVPYSLTKEHTARLRCWDHYMKLVGREEALAYGV
jgi:hypothetical protein